MVSEKQKADLIFLIADTNNYLSLPMAARIAERIIKEGWQWHPPKLEDFDLEHNKVALLPEQEIDMMDRIISGLPVDSIVVRPHPDHAGIADIVFPDGVKLYDVNSLHPQEVDIWKQIPDFENYEANPIGAVRSKWTKRVLEETDVDGQTMVEMHDKDGYPHEVNIRYVVEKTFTK